MLYTSQPLENKFEFRKVSNLHQLNKFLEMSTSLNSELGKDTFFGKVDYLLITVKLLKEFTNHS